MTRRDTGGRPLISVVVPTRNRAERLRALLDSLAEHRGPRFEVIVVDDASDDGTQAAIERAGVRGIRLPDPPPGPCCCDA